MAELMAVLLFLSICLALMGGFPVAFTLGTQPVSDPGAPVVPLPTASPSPPGSSLRVVDGSPGASSVIVLPSDAPRAKTLAAEDIALLVDQHGFSGALLRSVREARDLSLQDVADQTRISVRYLQGIEDEDFGLLLQEELDEF